MKRILLATCLLLLASRAHATVFNVTADSILTRANAQAVAGDKVVISSATYTVPIAPANSGDSITSRIRYCASATSGIDTSFTLTASTITRSYVTLYGLKIAGGVKFDVADTLHPATYDSLAKCVVVGGVSLWGAKRCVVARNRLVNGWLDFSGNANNGGFSGTTKEAGMSVACEADTVRANAIWLSAGLSDGDSRTFSVRAMTQRCVVDSNYIVGNFTDNGNASNPVVLWLQNARKNYFSDNTWKLWGTNAPNGGTNYYGLYIRDSSYANTFVRETYLWGDSISHTVIGDLGASGSFTTAGTSRGNQWYDCAFKMSGGLTFQSGVGSAARLQNCVIASSVGRPLDLSGAPDSLTIYWTTVYGRAQEVVNVGNNELTHGHLQNNLYLSTGAVAANNQTVAKWSGATATEVRDTCMYYSYGGDSCAASCLYTGLAGVPMKLPHFSGGCTWSDVQESHSFYVNPSVTDTTWASLDLRPASSSSPMHWTNKFNLRAGADLSVATYSPPAGKTSTTTTLASSANPSTYGTTIHFTATVTASATGTVQFRVAGANFGPPASLSGTTATSRDTSTLAVGTSVITAAYFGDASYDSSNGTLAGGQVVNKIATTTATTSSTNPSTSGNAVHFTATVTAGATGTVQFTVSSATFGHPVAISGTTAVSADTSTLDVGTHIVTADYLGDATHATSSGTLSGGQVVTGGVTATTLVITSNHNPAMDKQGVIFTATVSSASATGTVTFTVDGVAGLPITVAAGVASTAILSYSVGTHTVSAAYSGDTNYYASSGTLAGGQVVLAIPNTNPPWSCQ